MNQFPQFSAMPKPYSQSDIETSLGKLRDLNYALDASVILAITDAQGVITYANQKFCELSQYPYEALVGQTHRIVNSGYHPSSFFKSMWQTIQQGQLWHGDIKNKARDGSYYWVSTTIVPFLDDEQRPYQYVSFRTDITALKNLEAHLEALNQDLEARVAERTQVLQETIQQLEANQRQKERFLTALTHDLRTPLVAQSRALQLFHQQRHQLPPTLAHLTEQLIDSNDGLLAMVNTLLELHHYETGTIQWVLQPVRIQELVEACFGEMKLLADHKQITLINLLPETLPPIEGDYHQLKRLFTNLVGNALEHIPFQATVTIEDDDLGDCLLIKVIDTGPGIPKDQLPHLFDRYFMTHQTTKRIGSGLGLSICRMIVEGHHGTITAANRAAQSPGCSGAAFTIILPKCQPRSNVKEAIN